jgi:hypothetical protein
MQVCALLHVRVVCKLCTHSPHHERREQHRHVHQREEASDHVLRIILRIPFTEAQLLFDAVHISGRNSVHAMDNGNASKAGIPNIGRVLLLNLNPNLYNTISLDDKTFGIVTVLCTFVSA